MARDDCPWEEEQEEERYGYTKFYSYRIGEEDFQPACSTSVLGIAIALTTVWYTLCGVLPSCIIL